MLSTIRVNSRLFCTTLFLFIGLTLFHTSALADVRHSNGKIAFTSDRDGNREIYVMNADGTGQRRLTNNPGVDDYPAWSPDGRRIAFLSQDQTGGYSIKLINADGTGSVPLTTASVDPFCVDFGYACGLSWSPDGTRIAFTDGSDIAVINSDGTGRVNLTNTPSPYYEINPSWSPDGSQIVFTYSNSLPYIYSSAFIMDANGSNLRPWPGTGSAGNLGDKDPAWSPNGTQVAAILNRYPVDSSDLCILNANGARTWLDFVIERDHASPAWSPDGEFLAFESIIDPYEQFTNHEVFVIKADGSSITRLTTKPGYDGHPSWQPIAAASYDFDGDGRSDLAVFRPSDGTWYLDRSSAGVASTQFGISTDQIAPADFDGDGKTDISVYRNGVWWWLNSSNGTLGVVQFGQAGDIPVPADYNGDRRAELAVYRNGQWWMLDLLTGQTSVSNFGLATDRPVPADYDGDGKVDEAVYRDGQWHLNQSSLGYSVVNFGLPTDKPVVADYDGDGKADPAVYRDGTWYLDQTSAGFSAFNWGLSTDVPVPADYDGDGKADAAVFRSGTWYLLQSANGVSVQQFGLPSDDPGQAAFQH